MRTPFTPHESAVAALILDGKTNTQIAALLGIKRTTVEARTKKMREKWHAVSDRHLTLLLAIEAFA